MKKILFILMLFVAFAQQGHAVLKEKDFNRTLHALRLELYNKWTRQKEIMTLMDNRRKSQHEQLVDMIKRCETTSLILYSQGQDFTFDMAYACQEATALHDEVKETTLPYDQIKAYINVEIANYDSLILVLRNMPPIVTDSMMNEHHDRDEDHLANMKTSFLLNEQGLVDRDVCLNYCQTLRGNMLTMLAKLEEDSRHYKVLTQNVERLNNFAQKKYTTLQQSIFINPGRNYFMILKSIPQQWMRMQSDFSTKYEPLKEKKADGQFKEYRTEWRGAIVLFASIFMIIYILGGTILSNVILRWLVPQRFRTRKFRQKRGVAIITLAVFLFAVAVMIVRSFIHHNLMLMATGLMIEMAWLIIAIYGSLLVRLKGHQIANTAKVYGPFIFMSMIVICFRIILIPNALVNIIFPAILLLFTIWQAFWLKKHWKHIPTSDSIYCSISLAVMLASCVLSWIGYTLMGVQIVVWWTFQLAAIATITCAYDLMEMYENNVLSKRIKQAYDQNFSASEMRFHMHRGDFIDQTWVYDFFTIAVVPICAIFSIIQCVWMAARIFDLRELVKKWFVFQIDVPGIFSASILTICLVLSLYFVFKYINYLVRSCWFRYRRKTNNKNFNATLAKNIIGLIVWGLYVIVAFLMLNVPGTGIAIVTGGLSTGLGFASKSLLENFFYGISLMTGRVRVGDYIEYDGMIGKVESITYQSTQITTLDGSIVAILNSDLFSKNFKNLTRNHQYERITIPFGVSYGSNVDEVRRMITEGVQQLCKKTSDGREIVNPKNPISVAFSDFGASSVDLILIAWVLVDMKPSFMAQAKEKIYQVLNENNIEIPFPQQDIYIRSIHKSEQN